MRTIFEKSFICVWVLILSFDISAQPKLYKEFIKEALSNDYNFIVLNIKHNSQSKILIGNLFQFSEIFGKDLEPKVRVLLYQALLNNDTIIINNDYSELWQDQMFGISDLKCFSTGQKLSSIRFNKRKRIVKNSFARDIQYKHYMERDWFRLIYSLWLKNVICQEDDEKGFLRMRSFPAKVGSFKPTDKRADLQMNKQIGEGVVVGGMMIGAVYTAPAVGMSTVLKGTASVGVQYGLRGNVDIPDAVGDAFLAPGYSAALGAMADASIVEGKLKIELAGVNKSNEQVGQEFVNSLLWGKAFDKLGNAASQAIDNLGGSAAGKNMVESTSARISTTGEQTVEEKLISK